MTEVDVSIDDLVLDVLKVTYTVHVLKGYAPSIELINLISQVVAQNTANLQAVKTVLASYVDYSIGTLFDVHAACIGKNTDVLSPCILCTGVIKSNEISCVSCLRILHFLSGKDGHGKLCQIIAGNIVQIRSLSHMNSCVRTVAPEALSSPNFNDGHRFSLLFWV